MFKNIGSNWLVSVVTMVAVYFLTPFTIHKLGDDGYGTWNLINAITGYLGLLVLGVPMASVRYFAQHVAKNDVDKLNEAIGSSTVMYLVLGVIAMVAGAAMYLFFVHGYHIPTAWQRDARVAFALVVLLVSLGFVALLPNAILAAHDEFVPRNVVRLWGVLLRLVLTFVLLALNASLTMLALVQIACMVFDFVFCWLVIRRRHPAARIRLRDCNWGMTRAIFAFSMYVLLLNAGGRLAFETDSIVIGAYMNVGSIPYFTVANSFIIYLMDFLLSIAAVVMPAATRLQTQGKQGELREIFLKWSKIALTLTLAAGLFLIVLGPRFIAWWVDPSFEQPAGQVLQILMLSYIVFLPVRGVALPMLMGLGKTGLPTVGFLVTGVLNLVLSIVLVKPLGLAGVALGTAIPNVLFAAAVFVQACKVLDVSAGDFFRYVVPRAVLGALPALALLLWLKAELDVRGLLAIAAAGVAMVVVFAATLVFFVYRNDPYLDLRSFLPRPLRAPSRV
ncbi:MAG TPA: polysaccharide biosynthesis C-terminal domain-containing protein [Gemmatimonadales bacterium]|nr:polysaccharide biosynthesis C-terminal domain-containing protein [Gemmatimonadales bacterium]